MRRSLKAALGALLIVPALTVAALAAPAMWEVSDADSKIWLFGSVHVLPSSLDWRTPVLDDAIKQASLVYFEADIGPLGQLGVILKAMLQGFAAKDDWFDALTTEQQGVLKAAIAPLGLSLDQVKSFAPWLAESIIEQKAMAALGYDPAYGVDETLEGELPKERKAYFETANGQLDMLAGTPEADQIKRLVASIYDIANLPSETKRMVDEWSGGDVDGLVTEISGDPTLDSSFQQTMLFDRNKNWIPTIEKMLADNQQDLIVVGAAHLAGDGSVIDLLGKAGYTVKRIQ